MKVTTRILAARRLGVGIVALTMILMVLGAWVKATGSGLSCPDWPTCYGDWFPPFPSADNDGTWEGEPITYSQWQVLYEWGHRLLASLLILPYAPWVYVTATSKDLHPTLRWLPGVAGMVLLVQITLGALTVAEGNSAPTTTAHLTTATAFFGLVVLATAYAYLHPTPMGGSDELRQRAENKTTVEVGAQPVRIRVKRRE